MKKADVISLKNQGKSNRAVARETGLNRETVSNYWEEYKRQLHELTKAGVDTKEIQEELVSKPKYNLSTRKAHKYTEKLEERLKEIIKAEARKEVILGPGHKQNMTNKQIYEIIHKEGYDIGISTICSALAKLRKCKKQVFIRQQYEFGDRIEYDFGEVRLVIAGKTGVYHMAVIASAAGKFRWCKLYTNEKKAVFMDSHVRFFEYVGGGY